MLELPQFHRAKALLLYLSMGSEVDTWGIFEQALAAGKEVFAPRCLDKQGHMAFYRVDSREDLVAGAFGLLEPDPARCPLWPVSYTHLDVYKRQEMGSPTGSL